MRAAGGVVDDLVGRDAEEVVERGGEIGGRGVVGRGVRD